MDFRSFLYVYLRVMIPSPRCLPGAKYVATGRGLPTYRRPFIGETEPGTTKLTKAPWKDRDEWHCLMKKHIFIYTYMFGFIGI